MTDIEVIPTEESADNQDKSKTEEDDELEANEDIRSTQIAIDPTGLGAPHWEYREP